MTLKVMPGHWKWPGSMGYVLLPISGPWSVVTICIMPI